MTFILKAQNRSQGIKPKSSAAGIKSRNILITAILFCLFALSTGFLMFYESKFNHGYQQKTVLEHRQEATKSDVSKKSNEHNLEFESIQAQIDSSYTSKPNEVFLANLAKKVTSHIYTENPKDRSVTIGGKAYQIGERYESIEIRDISEKGISIRVRKSGSNGTDFTLSLVEIWLEK